MLRRVLVMGAPLSALSAAPIVKINEEKKEEKLEKSFKCKPSELPIYSSLVDDSEKHCEHKPSKLALTIEEGVKVVRVEVTKVTDLYDSQKSNVERHYVNFMKDTQHYRNYLQEEDNTLPRVGAIAVSSLAGVVLGIRGGFFKKIFYASLTGGGMYALCYPRDAKKYATIAYNFAYGKKPGDEGIQKDLPKFPSSFSEVKDRVVDLSNKAYDTVFKK